MNSRYSVALILLFSLPTFAQAPVSSFVQGTPADEAAIRAIVASELADSEDQHIAQDLDWENAFGIRYSNLQKRNAWFNANIKPQFKHATNDSLEVKIRFLEPAVAVGDEYWHVAGQVYAGESKPGADRWGCTTYIFKKEAGVWTEVMERVADLRSAYFKHYDALPTAVPVDPATLGLYAGKYEVSGKLFAEVSVTGDHLTIVRHGRTFVGVPVSSTEFLSFDPDDLASYHKLTFVLAEEAPGSTSLRLSYPGGELLVTAAKTR